MKISICHLLAQFLSPFLECSEPYYEEEHEDNVDDEEERDKIDIDILGPERNKEIDVLSKVGKLFESECVPGGGPVAVVGNELETFDDDEDKVKMIADLSGCTVT